MLACIIIFSISNLLSVIANSLFVYNSLPYFVWFSDFNFLLCKERE